MATTTASDGLQNSGVQNSTTRGVDDSSVIRIFQLASSLGILVFLGFLIVSERANLDGSLPEIALWAAVALAADLMLVRVGKGVTLTMSLPVSLAAVEGEAASLEVGEERVEDSVAQPILDEVGHLGEDPGGNEVWSPVTLDDGAAGEFLPGTAEALLTVSPQPDWDVPALLRALDRYAYGCLVA